MIFEWVAVFGVYNIEDFSFSFLKLHLFIHPPIRFPIGANSTQEACLFKKKKKVYFQKKALLKTNKDFDWRATCPVCIFWAFRRVETKCLPGTSRHFLHFTAAAARARCQAGALID